MLGQPTKLASDVYMVGGPEMTDPRDCLCYLVAGPEARVLIDCGSGPSAADILDLVNQAVGRPPTHLLITHAHIDHAGGAAEIKELTGCQLLIHPEEEGILAGGDAERSAATWYGLPLKPAAADRLLEHGDSIDLGGGRELNIVHTPGHTPGSICAWYMAGEVKVLFGQDIHGPFMPAFRSDITAWRDSMRRLLDLKADLLAEGHYGIFKPAEEVAEFIQSQLRQHTSY